MSDAFIAEPVRLRDQWHMDSSRKGLGGRIRSARLAANLTQQELANRVGVAMQTIWRYEKGTQEISLETARSLSSELGISLDELMGNAPAESLTVYDRPEHPAFAEFVTKGWPERLHLDAVDLEYLRGLNFRDGLTVNNLVAVASNLATMHDAPERPEMVAARAKNDADGVKRKAWKKK